MQAAVDRERFSRRIKSYENNCFNKIFSSEVRLKIIERNKASLEKMNKLYVDIQGFYFNTEFICKEMTLLYKQHMYHYLFKVPYNFTKSDFIENKSTIKYLEKYYHGLHLYTGFIGIEELPIILNYFKDVDLIFVRGHQKKNYILKHFPKINIINLEEDMESPKLEKSFQSCMYHNIKPAMCSLINVQKIYEYVNKV